MASYEEFKNMLYIVTWLYQMERKLQDILATLLPFWEDMESEHKLLLWIVIAILTLIGVSFKVYLQYREKIKIRMKEEDIKFQLQSKETENRLKIEQQKNQQNFELNKNTQKLLEKSIYLLKKNNSQLLSFIKKSWSEKHTNSKR